MERIHEHHALPPLASGGLLLTPVAPADEAPPAGATLDERRGAAMRRLFPKRYGGGAARPTGQVALQMYAYLAEATTLDELERRLRLAARYPIELIEEVAVRDGRRVLVRPVLPPDAAKHRAFVQAMSTTTRIYRFHGVVADLPERLLRYLTEVDYVDHFALVGEVADATGTRLVAEARWVRRQEDRGCADFAIAIADDYQLGGLGNALLDRLQRSARAKGVDRLRGHVLRNNGRMRGWLEARGWRMEPDPEEPGVVCAELRLLPLEAPAWREAA